MERILTLLLENSIYAAIVTVIVLLVRLALRRAPKVFSYMLWSVVFFRLLCPVPVNFGFSIVPSLNEIQTVQSYVDEFCIQPAQKRPTVTTEPYVTQEPIDMSGYTEPPTVSGTGAADVNESPTAQLDTVGQAEQRAGIQTALCFGVWSAGVVTALVWLACAWIRLRARVSTATRVNSNAHRIIYESDQITTAFVFGIFRPHIYVPTWLGTKQYRYVVEHERTHIRRLDYIIKPAAFVLSAIYWFSPFVWLSYRLMCDDMEMSCDEAVLRRFGDRIKGGYCSMLLNLETKKTLSVETAFGESSAKARIKNVLSFKKAPKAVVIASLLAVLLVFTACVGTAGESGTSVFGSTGVSGTDTASGQVEKRFTYEQDSNHTITYRKVLQDNSGRYELDEWYEVAGYTGTPTNVIIPSEHNGLTVLNIAPGAFKGCLSLETIKLPDSLVTIYDNAFEGCERLRHIDLAGIKYIGADAFSGCGAMSEIIIPDTMVFINQHAFAGCTSLKTLRLPDTELVYASGVFRNIGIESLVLPSTFRIIPSYLFEQCVQLTSVVLPVGIEAINEYAFSGCSRLAEINIPDNTRTIRKGAFENCISLKRVKIPKDVENSELIRDIAFKGCTSLELTDWSDDSCVDYSSFADRRADIRRVSIPDHAQYIGLGGFADCQELKTVTMADSVTRIGDKAFWSCYALESVQLSEGLSYIGYEAFGACRSLTTVEIPEGVEHIGSYAFFDCSKLTSVTLPEGLTAIEEGTFGGCSSLESITIPHSVAYIDRCAFMGCTALKKLVIPNGTMVDKEAFYGCETLSLRSEDGTRFTFE